MEPIKLDIAIDGDDMYRFQMYHTYHSNQGILSVILGILSIVFAVVAPIMAPERIQPLDIAFYAGVGLVFLFYYPVSFKKKAPMMVEQSAVLTHPLHYTFDDNGITVEPDEAVEIETGEAQASLPWESIYKAIFTKDQLLIYSNKVNAYILPYDKMNYVSTIKELIVKKVPDYRVVIKQ